MSFDSDTALEPAGEGRWRGVVPATWSIGPGPNGGFMAALAARAAALATGTPPRSLTLHYLAPPAEADIEVAAEVVRQGRSAGFTRMEMIQDGRTVVLGLAVCGPWKDDAPAWQDATPPDLPPPDDCVRVEPGRSNVPPLIGRYDMRIAPAPEGERPARLSGWIRTAESRAADEVALAAITDAYIPPAFLRSPEPILVPTLELTIHFRGVPPEGEHPWIAATFLTRSAGGGVCEEDGELWSADGRLLAQSRQLSLVCRRS